MELLFFWLYIGFSYICPGILLFYTFVIENILNNDVSIWSKIGAVGIFILVICLLIGILVINKVFTRTERKYEKLSIKEIDNQKRAEYILKWSKTERTHNIFKQALMLAVFIAITILVIMLENKLLALRGTMTTISILFGIGFMCFITYENIKLKNIEGKKVE